MDAIHKIMVIFQPLGDMLAHVTSILPTFISALVVLIVGIVFSKVVRNILDQLFREIYIDKLIEKLGLSNFLHMGGTKYKLSGLLSSLIYLVLVVAFIMMTLEILGIAVLSHVMDRLVTYVLQVASAIVILAIGMVGAKVMGTFIHIIAHNINLPQPKLLESMTRWAILLYVFKVTLSELGYGFLFGGTIFNIWFAGVVLALALAFGLGGRDAAAKYLGKEK